MQVKFYVVLGLLLLAGSGFAASREVTTVQTYTGVCTISPGTTSETWHVQPNGSLVVNTDKSGNNYIEIRNVNPSALELNGGSISAGALALRGEYSTYRQQSGTMTLNESGFLIDGGTVELLGGTCSAVVNFRNCSSATFTMGGGRLRTSSVTGSNMARADFRFRVTNDAFAVTTPWSEAMITATTPITQVPKSLTIDGDPVPGCVYALVDGLTNDTFFTALTPSVPTGWMLARIGRRLLLAEPDSLAITAATWTGAVGDGDPRTPGNWICRDAAGTIRLGAIPGVATTVSVPSDAATFTFPADKAIPLAEVRFLGTSFALAADVDWTGLTSDVLTMPPTTIDLNGHTLRVCDEPVPAVAEVTSGVAGGTLLFDIPAGGEVSLAHVALTGALTVVKEGAGVLSFVKTHQTFTGGVDVRAGSIWAMGEPAYWTFGGASRTQPAATVLTLHAGTMLDLRAYAGWGYTTMVLDGGTVAGRSTLFNPRMQLTAPSTLQVVASGDLNVKGAVIDLGGQTLTVSIASGKYLKLESSVISNGVLDVVQGGWVTNQTALDARTVDLKIGSALALEAELSVRDYEAKFTSNYSSGTAPLKVYGTFTPTTDFFYGCTLQDGATLNLAAKTGAWSTTSAFTGALNVVTFADGARVTVELGDRLPEQGEQLIAWTPATKPANLSTLTFVDSHRHRRLFADAHGVYYRSGFLLIVH